MKRTTTKATKETAKKATERNYPVFPLNGKISIEKEGKRTTYILGEGVNLDIFEGEKNDYGSLNIYGVVIRVTFREIKKGEKAGNVFVSYPQYKKGNGEYVPYVINYSKELNDAINKALAIHYDGGDFVPVPEDEELPFE